MRTRFAAVAVIALATPAWAEDLDDKDREVHGTEKGTIGIGIIIPIVPFSVPWTSRSLSSRSSAHADYVLHPYVLQSRDSFVLATYVGPGVRLIQYSNGRDDSSNAIGLRAVGGLLFDFKNPLDAFIEVAGVFEYEFRDDRGFAITLNASAGVRYYF
jgi:hypothetical protein